MSKVGVFSEIGKLNRVMLHKPSKELDLITPDNMAQLLFDDVPYLELARKEHDLFADTLARRGTEVLYLGDCLKSILLAKNDLRKQFIDDFIAANNIFSPDIKEALVTYYSGLSIDHLVEAVFSGLRRDELNINPKDLAGLVHNNDSLFWIAPLPNLYFTRDPGAIIGSGLSISCMFKEARKVETLFMTYLYKHHELFKDVPLWYDDEIGHSLEGGDELVLSEEVVAIGCSERTSIRGIEYWAKQLLTNEKAGFKKVLVISIPKTRSFMHLDTVFTMIDHDKFTVHAEAVGTLPIYELTAKNKNELNIKHMDKLDVALANALKVPAVKLIKCAGGDAIAAGREQWNDGSNTLTIAPGVVVVYDRNYITNDFLRKNGIEVIEVASSELSRGRGGPRCMSMPICRDRF